MLRRERVTEAKNIQVSVSDVKVLQRTNERAEITFRQDYRSDNYQDSVRKRLELVRDGERWLIADEQVVRTLTGPSAEPTTESATALSDKENPVNQVPIAAAPVQQGDVGDVQQNAATEAPPTVLAELQTSTEIGVSQMEAKAQTGEDSARRDPAVPQQRTVELAEVDTAAPHALPKNPSELDKRARLQVEQSCKRGGIEFPRYKGRCLY